MPVKRGIIEIHQFFKVIIEKMESLFQQLGNLNLSDDFYVGHDLSNESNFLEKKKKIEEQVTFSNCGFNIRKRIMRLSVELLVTPTEAIAKILLNTIDEIFAKQETLYKIGLVF